MGLATVGPFVLLGILADLGTITVSRWALRKCEDADSWPSGLAALAAIIPVGFLLSGAPIYVFRHVGGWYITLPVILLAVAVPVNIFDAMFAVALSLWIFVLVAHKLLWPIASSLVERIYELIPSRKGMVGAGLALIALSGWDLAT